MKNILVVPAFYNGTSFEDIFNSMNSCLLKSKMNIEVIGLKEPFKNELHSDILDDNRFFIIQQDILIELTQQLGIPCRILFLDFFFPGIDMVKYFFEKNHIQVKMGALLHGGAFLSDDIFSEIDWLRNVERGYFSIFDVVYSPSVFLKDKVAPEFKTKVKVLPWGLDSFKALQPQIKEKKIDVLFPHRIAADKGIEDLIKISTALPEIDFYITAPQGDESSIAPAFSKLFSLANINFIFGESSKAHAQTLASSKLVLSCAKQENFGYAIHKSILSGCIPVLPKGVCYEEFITSEYIYNDTQQAVNFIRKWVTEPPEWNVNNIYKNYQDFTFLDLLIDFYEY